MNPFVPTALTVKSFFSENRSYTTLATSDHDIVPHALIKY